MSKIVDFIIRDCGQYGFLPIIEVEIDHARRTLYRGVHHNTRRWALDRMQEVWDNELTGDIKEFKTQTPTCFEGCPE